MSSYMLHWIPKYYYASLCSMHHQTTPMNHQVYQQVTPMNHQVYHQETPMNHQVSSSNNESQHKVKQMNHRIPINRLVYQQV